MQSTDTIFNIILGSACNWKCPYCLQNNESHFNKEQDVKKFCASFLPFLEKNYLSKNKPINRFTIWGGEPFLYFKELKYLLDALKDVPTIKRPRVTTNGSLLTKEHVKFLNDYDVFINLSYHQGQLTEDKWKVALGIRQLHVTSLIHHQLLSWELYYKKWAYIYKRFGRCLNWYIYPMLYVNDLPKEYILTKEDVDIYFSNLTKYLDKLDNVFYRNAIKSIVYTYWKKLSKNTLGNYCFNSYNYALDLKGNKYLCHHDFSSKTIVENIFSNTGKHSIPIIPIEYVKGVKQGESLECKKCRAYKICFGGCFRARSPETDCYFTNKAFTLLETISNRYSQYFPSFNFLSHEIQNNI